MDFRAIARLAARLATTGAFAIFLTGCGKQLPPGYCQTFPAEAACNPYAYGYYPWGTDCTLFPDQPGCFYSPYYTPGYFWPDDDDTF